MTTTMRIEDTLKSESEAILQDLGLNMSAAVTLFLKQVVKQRGIPFMLRCDYLPMTADRIVARDTNLHERGRTVECWFAQMRRESERDMSIDEINAEISAARKERKRRQKARTL